MLSADSGHSVGVQIDKIKDAIEKSQGIAVNTCSS